MLSPKLSNGPHPARRRMEEEPEKKSWVGSPTVGGLLPVPILPKVSLFAPPPHPTLVQFSVPRCRRCSQRFTQSFYLASIMCTSQDVGSWFTACGSRRQQFREPAPPPSFTWELQLAMEEPAGHESHLQTPQTRPPQSCPTPPVSPLQEDLLSRGPLERKTPEIQRNESESGKSQLCHRG